MDQKKLEEFCRAHAVCVKHADARNADSRTKLEESPEQPIVVKELLPLPHDCEDCGRSLADRKKRTHTYTDKGWRSHCSGCNKARVPGSDVFGQTKGVKASERGININEEEKVNRLGPRPELLPVPIEQPQPDLQSDPIEVCPNGHDLVGFVEQVVVRDYHESVIKEYSRLPVCSQAPECDALTPDSEVRTD
mgnify:CR=1 FL=1